MTTPTPASHRSTAGHFPTTHWSRVVAAVDLAAPEATEALASLCDAYWYPIYAYVRRQGHRSGGGSGPDAGLLRLYSGAGRALQSRPDARALPHLSEDRLCPTACGPSRPRERAQARGRPAGPLDRRQGRRGTVRPRAGARAHPGADLRADLGADIVGPGDGSAPPRVRRCRTGGDLRRASDRVDWQPRIRLLRCDRRTAWAVPRGPSASPFIAFAAATASCSARRSPPRSTTRARLPMRSMRFSRQSRTERKWGVR